MGAAHGTHADRTLLLSTAALLWVHDDHDVLGPNIDYLLTQVDEVLVRHRDAAKEALSDLVWAATNDRRVRLQTQSDNRYDQSAVMTEMAKEALDRGHQWAVPVDPDEIWYANGTTLRDFFAGISRDVMVVKAELYNHIPSKLDPKNGTPFEKIGWRQTKPMSLGKVAVRLRPDLIIEHGNHSARSSGVQFTVGPLIVVRHFPWRTPEQFVERVRTAYAQLQASNLDQGFGVHVRAYGKCLEDEGEEALKEHFIRWFYSPDPEADDSLVFDPAPLTQ